MGLSTKFDEALQFASDLHRAQVRNTTTIPYISHLLSVSALVLENGGDEQQAIAALLHDSLEDQAKAYGGEALLGSEIERRFGVEVRAIVEACTDFSGAVRAPWRVRKEAYIASLPKKGARAALVTAADKLHNARSIVADLHRIGPEVFKRFAGGCDGVLWYYRSLADAFSAHYPGFLAAEFARTVDLMEGLSGTGRPQS